MNEMILLKLGELVLKGINRYRFEDKLRGNINRRVKPFGKFRVYSRQSICYVEPQNEECDIDGAYDTLTRVFGVIGLSRAKSCEKTKEDMFETACSYLHERLSTAKSFKVESKRADKSFPMTSIQLSQWVGGQLHETYPNLTVDVHNPELTVHLEVRDYCAFVHADPLPGAGGLPVGTSGKAISLLSGGIDSPVASWMMARRGLWMEMVHFYSYPYTSLEARDKVLKLAEELTPWCGRLAVHVVPFTKIQEELRRNCPEEYFTIVMRRFMMRISERIAINYNCGALITGESLGQVASQTMDAMNVTGEVVNLPVFRPLVGMDKEEVVKLSRKIGTYDTSILPFEDCCTVFTPRHPRTHPKPEEIVPIEAELDIEALIEEALAGVERIVIDAK